MLSRNLKSFQERVECQDRMERRAIRDRIAIERQSGLRDLILRGDLSAWLESRIAHLEREAEKSGGKNAEDAAFMRTLLRSSKRRKRAFISELQSGTLRRAASEDDLRATAENLEVTSSEVAKKVAESPKGCYGQDIVVSELSEMPDLQELRVSDHPHHYPLVGAGANPDEVEFTGPGRFQQPRVRHNSAGDETSRIFRDFGDFNIRELNFDPTTTKPLFAPAEEEEANMGNFYENHCPVPPLLMPPPLSSTEGAEVISYSTNSEVNTVSSASGSSSRTGLHSHNSLPGLRQWPVPQPMLLGNRQQQQRSETIYQNFNHIQRPIPLQPSKGQLPVPPPKPQGYLQQQHSQSELQGAQQQPPPLLPKQHIPPPYRPPPFQHQYNFHQQASRAPAGMPAIGEDTFLAPGQHPLVLGSLTKTTSDGGGSHDSHNDSGYCTRPGGASSGPSPSLSGNKLSLVLVKCTENLIEPYPHQLVLRSNFKLRLMAL